MLARILINVFGMHGRRHSIANARVLAATWEAGI
jgi:hypothetical protein